MTVESWVIIVGVFGTSFGFLVGFVARQFEINRLRTIIAIVREAAESTAAAVKAKHGKA